MPPYPRRAIHLDHCDSEHEPMSILFKTGRSTGGCRGNPEDCAEC